MCRATAVGEGGVGKKVGFPELYIRLLQYVVSEGCDDKCRFNLKWNLQEQGAWEAIGPNSKWSWGIQRENGIASVWSVKEHSLREVVFDAEDRWPRRRRYGHGRRKNWIIYPPRWTEGKWSEVFDIVWRRSVDVIEIRFGRWEGFGRNQRGKLRNCWWIHSRSRLLHPQTIGLPWKELKSASRSRVRYSCTYLHSVILLMAGANTRSLGRRWCGG